MMALGVGLAVIVTDVAAGHGQDLNWSIVQRIIHMVENNNVEISRLEPFGVESAPFHCHQCLKTKITYEHHGQTK